MAEKLSILKIFMVSCVAVAINIGFSALASYGIPVILATGLPLKYSTFIYSVSSLLSFLLQGFLGTSSDQCNCRCGRRRPFIVVFSVFTVIGLILTSYSFYFSSISKELVTAGVLLGIIVTDFNVGLLQLPSRAYLLDVISPSQAETANFIYSALFGVGTTIGTLVAAIKWSSVTHQSLTVPHQAQIVYAFAAVVIIACMIVSICSVKEKRYYERVAADQFVVNYTVTDEDNEDDFEIQANSKSCIGKFLDPFIDIFVFLSKMSRHMWLLWVMFFCSFLALVLFNSYVTLYVGTVVFGGDPDANHTTESYQRYASGVHTGAWSLLLAAITNSIFGLVLNFVIKFLSLKTIFLTSTTLYCVGSCLLIYFHELPLVFAVGAIYGFYFSLTLTVPYILIPIYKDRGMLFRKGHSIDDEAIEGRACAVINTAMFLSQLVVALVSGPLLSVVDDNIYVMFFACVTCFLTFFSILFVSMPEAPKLEKRDDEVDDVSIPETSKAAVTADVSIPHAKPAEDADSQSIQ